MNALVDDILRVLAHEFEDVLHESLVRQTAQPNAVFTCTGRDYVLRKYRRKLWNGWRWQYNLLRVSRPVQHLRGGKSIRK